MRAIYLDYQSTTPVDPRVFESMRPWFSERFGNSASAAHAYGWEAAAAVELAREQVAVLVGATPREVVFTSGATEANNLAILGLAQRVAVDGASGGAEHYITSAAEHASVLGPFRALERAGARVTWLPVDARGQVSVAAVAAALTPETVLVSLMSANNEVHTLNPVAEIGALCHARGVLFHVDATQSAGKLPLDVSAMRADLLSWSAHKMYGPKGAGALYVRRRDPRVELEPILHGGGHERGLRPGTLNTPAIVGFGVACEIAAREMAAEAARLRAWRDQFWVQLRARVPAAQRLGHETECLPHALSFSVPGVGADALLSAARGLAFSTGSACAALKPGARGDGAGGSHVLAAMGVPDEVTEGSVRMSFGRMTTEADAQTALKRMVAALTGG